MKEEKKLQILSVMQKLDIKDKDLEEKFILGSGKGGQKASKTSSCVYLKHLPSGLEVKCQATRERETNRFLAKRMLCEKFQELQGEKTKKQTAIEKIRKQKKRRKRKQRPCEEE